MKRSNLTVIFILLLANAWCQDCPSSISVSASSFDVMTGQTFQISADVKGVPAKTAITYNWSISSGSIISGQGTSVIKVDPGTEPGYCTATVEIGGLSAKCTSTQSTTVEIRKAPEKIISTNMVTPAGITEAVRKFIEKTDLKNINITQTAQVNIYTSTTQPFIKIKAIVEKAFEANGIFPYQYTIVDSGIHKTASLDMLLLKEMY